MRPVAALLAVVAVLPLVALAAGCGESVTLPDLFVVTRTGGAPLHTLTVLVNEGGSVRCNGGSTHQLSDPQLIQARGIAEELQSPSAHHLALSAQPGSVFSYHVRDAEGTVRFADNSRHQPPAFRHLALLVLEIQQKLCHLPT